MSEALLPDSQEEALSRGARLRPQRPTLPGLGQRRLAKLRAGAVGAPVADAPARTALLAFRAAAAAAAAAAATASVAAASSQAAASAARATDRRSGATRAQQRYFQGSEPVQAQPVGRLAGSGHIRHAARRCHRQCPAVGLRERRRLSATSSRRPPA